MDETEGLEIRGCASSTPRRAGFFLLAAAVVVVGLMWRFGSAYPGRITTPEAVGVVASKSTDDFDAPEARLALADGREVTLRRGDRELVGGVGVGDLVLFGTTPEHWHVIASLLQGTDCYPISAESAFSVPDGVVLVWSRWSDVGIRLRKAPGYDDIGLLEKDLFGHLYYRPFEQGSGVSFCLDPAGRVARFRH